MDLLQSPVSPFGLVVGSLLRPLALKTAGHWRGGVPEKNNWEGFFSETPTNENHLPVFYTLLAFAVPENSFKATDSKRSKKKGNEGNIF